MFGYFMFVDFENGNSLLPVLLVYGLCWPVIAIGKMVYGPGFISNFDPILVQKFGWLALWAYYYVLVSAGCSLYRVWKRATQPPE